MAKTDDKKDESVGGMTQGNKSFKYADALENCDEAIEKYMSEPDGVYYRLVHNPLHPNDDIPQPLQQWDALTSEQVVLTTKVPKESSIEEQWEQVRIYSPSYNVSDVKLAESFLVMLDRRKNDRQKQRLLDKKGDTIIAVRLTPNDGLIQTNPDDNPDGHVVFQPFEEFNIEEHIDDTFEPRKLIDYRHEDEKE